MARIYEQYAVVETNDVAAVRNGRIKAQYPMDDQLDAENGMLLVVDDVNEVVGFSADGTEAGIHLHASEERMYESHLGRKAWFLDGHTQIPKMLKLAEGDLFETNAVDDGDFANLAAVKAALAAVPAEAVYGIAGPTGLIELKDGTDAGWAAAFDTYTTVLQVVKFVNLPNDTEGIKFTVVKGEA